MTLWHLMAVLVSRSYILTLHTSFQNMEEMPCAV